MGARKDELMRQREQEEKEIADEKNRLAKAMLDSQEKIMDNSAELDALRARRYAEARRGRTDKFQQAQDEGRAMRNEFAMERAKLDAIRDAMIEDMLKRGYNPNYLNEIRNCDIQKIQMR